VLVLASPQSYVSEIGRFFDSLHLDLGGGGGVLAAGGPGVNSGGAVPAASGPGLRMGTPSGVPRGNYVLQIPPTWMHTPSPGRIALVSAVYSTGERCDPMRPATKQVGGQVARIVGVGKRPLVSPCSENLRSPYKSFWSAAMC